MRQAIAAGQPIDVGLTYSTDQVGPLCSSGDFTDLASFITRDKVDLTQIPETVLGYTEYNGKRCTMPALADVYGLYYNKKLLAAAGYTEPPKTLAELTDMAKKLTDVQPGRLDQAARLHAAARLLRERGGALGAVGGRASGSTTTARRRSAARRAGRRCSSGRRTSSPSWAATTSSPSSRPRLGEEFSAQNDFQTGRVAMNLDGEYRTAFIADQAKDLDYGTAPFPSAQGFEDTLRRRLHHRQHRRHRQGLEEPRGGLGVHQVPDDEHRRAGQALERPQERADDARRDHVARTSRSPRSSRRSSTSSRTSTPRPRRPAASARSTRRSSARTPRSGSRARSTTSPGMLKTVDQEIDAAVQLQAGS